MNTIEDNATGRGGRDSHGSAACGREGRGAASDSCREGNYVEGDKFAFNN
jgi:hypothetical protein